LIWGNCIDASLGEKISITLIATGFEEGGKKQGKEIVSHVALDESFGRKEMDGFEIGIETRSGALTVDFDQDDVKAAIDPGKYNKSTSPYVGESAEEKRRKRIRELDSKRPRGGDVYTNIKASPDVSIDNPSNIKDLEKIPAYKRKKILLDDVKAADDFENDNYRVTIDSEEVIESNNSYLHDNVD